MPKSDIKLYGKITNGDGNLLVSPLEVAGVNTDGSIPEGAATSENNIVSYINKKIKGVNSYVDNVKTGIKSVKFSNDCLTESNYNTKLIVVGNDSTHSEASFSIDGKKILKGIIIDDTGTITPSFGNRTTLAKFWKDTWDGTVTNVPLGSVDITLPDNNAVGTAWSLSQVATDYKKSVTNEIGTAKREAINAAATDATSKSNKALDDAKKYADVQIGMKLGKVYKPQGNASLTTIITINPKNNIGNVWNMTEKFRIDGKVYPRYTNIVIVDSESLPEKLIYDAGTESNPGKGFSGDVVDALGGMIDQTAIQDNITEKFNKSVIGISTPTTVVSFNPITSGDITQSITYTLGDNTPGTFSIKLHNNGAGANINAVDGKKDIVSKVTVTKNEAGLFSLNYSGIKTNGTQLDYTQNIDFKATSTTYGMVKPGENVNITNTGIISVPTADKDGNIAGVVKLGPKIFLNKNGKLDIPLGDSTQLGLVAAAATSSVSLVDGWLDIKLAVDSGINKDVTTGELSIPKNTFTAGTGIDIKKTSNDFTIGFNTTYVSDAASPAGQPLYYNKIKNGFYINTDSNLSVTTDTDKSTKISINTTTLKSTLGLNSKADNSALQALTSRVAALESLLSLG